MMHDEMLLSVIRAGGERWQSLVARAIAARLRLALADGIEAFEDCGGRLEDAILDAGCSLRAVAAALATPPRPGRRAAKKEKAS